MVRRERGEGGLFKPKGTRFYYAQWYDSTGRKHRVSTKEEGKMKALAFLQERLHENNKGLRPATDARKLTYANMRETFLMKCKEKGNRTVMKAADGSEYVT